MDLECGELPAPSIDPFQGLRIHHAGQKNQYFLSTRTKNEIGLPDPFQQEYADGPQHLIAGAMAVVVIETLEMVEIQHDHRQTLILPAGLRDQAGADFLQQSPIMQTGQGIPCRLLAQAGFQPGAPGNIAQQQQTADLPSAMVERQQSHFEMSLRHADTEVARRPLATFESVGDRR
jgi:hypothetical protein